MSTNKPKNFRELTHTCSAAFCAFAIIAPTWPCRSPVGSNQGKNLQKTVFLLGKQKTKRVCVQFRKSEFGKNDGKKCWVSSRGWQWWNLCFMKWCKFFVMLWHEPQALWMFKVSLSLSLCTALAGLCPPFGRAGADTAVLNWCNTSQVWISLKPKFKLRGCLVMYPNSPHHADGIRWGVKLAQEFDVFFFRLRSVTTRGPRVVEFFETISRILQLLTLRSLSYSQWINPGKPLEIGNSMKGLF